MLRSAGSIAARYAVRSERGCTSRSCVQNQTNCLYPYENSCINCERWTKTVVRYNENSEFVAFECPRVCARTGDVTTSSTLSRGRKDKVEKAAASYGLFSCRLTPFSPKANKSRLLALSGHSIFSEYSPAAQVEGRRNSRGRLRCSSRREQDQMRSRDARWAAALSSF
jgi:hypothetical protein